VSVHTQLGLGSEFVGYRIDELIGRGGMGVVYRAYDLRLKRTVALKLMAPELALDQSFRERFSREAELAMSLEHPNVVPIHDAGDIDGRLYLAMRDVQGTDLRALLRAEGALDPARALAVCGAVASALDAAHAKGLVHRDVKPSNVLLDASGHVYLADFGLTRRLDEQGGAAGDGRSVGTPAYVAPEQIEGGQVDGRADVYSLGCLLYECLTGQTPFAGSRLEVAWAHLEQDPPSASARRPDLPEAIDAVIGKAMAKEPGDRYPSCAAAIAAAEEALELRKSQTSRRSRMLVAAVAILLIVAAVLAAALVIRGGGSPPAPPAVTADTLVRIDPKTNAFTNVVGVGPAPSATAVGGNTVWVYNAGDASLSEVDSVKNAVEHTTTLDAVPSRPDGNTGPVLAADPGGAWIIGVDRHGRSYLTRVFAAPRGSHEYRLQEPPRAVATGYGAVLVVIGGARDDEVLRISPGTGRVLGRTHFPRSSRLDGLAVGLGGVWATSFSSAMLYRIDPHTGRVTGRRDLGKRAGRPELVFGQIWVDVADPTGTGDAVIVDPQSMNVVGWLGCCPGLKDDNATGFDSIWTFDPPSGTVVRWSSVTEEPTSDIHLLDSPIYTCSWLTSIATGAGGVWVTVGPTSSYGC
jgi:Protein kinase domain